MAEVTPFRGIRYDEAVVGPLGAVISPPYDVIGETQRKELLSSSPYNFVRVELPRSDEDPYAAAATTFSSWLQQGVLRRDPRPAVYIHDHEFTAGGVRLRRRGIHLALRLHPLEEGIVRPHELTFPKAKADRLALLRATRANTSAVFALYADPNGEIARILDRATQGGGRAPIAEAAAHDERHRVWALDDARTLGGLRDRLATQRVYIADGHHRYETALNHLAERGPGLKDDAPERFVLAYLCALEDPGLRILATHRIVRGDGVLDRASERFFDASPIDAGALGDIQPGIVVVRDGIFRQLHVKPGADLTSLREAWRELPIAQAEELLLREARERGAEISYEHDAEAAMRAATRGATAVLVRPVDPQTLRRVADAGERLPQKTTYFYPKVPAGLVVRALE